MGHVSGLSEYPYFCGAVTCNPSPNLLVLSSKKQVTSNHFVSRPLRPMLQATTSSLLDFCSGLLLAGFPVSACVFLTYSSERDPLTYCSYYVIRLFKPSCGFYLIQRPLIYYVVYPSPTVLFGPHLPPVSSLFQNIADAIL